jgi:hypothetical protein
MPPTIMLYKCEAAFTGRTSAPYGAYPTLNSVHGCILFLRQADGQADADHAIEILAQWGWTNVVIKAAKPIQAESLNDPSMHVFRKYYEECLEHGDSLVWYP